MQSDIVLSSRVRLARNYADLPFELASEPEQAETCILRTLSALRQAGLEGKIELTCQPLEKLKLEGEPGVFLCNPPYGERLEDRKTCEGIYRELGRMMRRHPGWSLCAITSDPTFERSFGRRADKKRRLYNGRLECEFMTFLDPKSAKRK